MSCGNRALTGSVFAAVMPSPEEQLDAAIAATQKAPEPTEHIYVHPDFTYEIGDH